MTRPSGAREMGILRLAARSPLGPAPAQLLRESLRDPFDGERLVALARRHGVHPLLSRSLDRVEHPKDRAWRRDLRGACRRCLGRNLMLETELDRLAALLEQRRIPVLSGRGPRLARQLYGSPDLRESERPEILVREEDAGRAWTVLKGAGYRIDPLPRRDPGGPGAGAEEALSLVHEGGPLPIVLDLRWGPPGGLHTRVDMAGVWRRAAWPASPAAPQAAHSSADLLLLLSLQGGSLGWSRLRLLSDIDACIQRHGSRLDWKLLAARARQWRMSDILERALRLTAAILRTELPGAADACLAGGHWRRDPLADPRTWLDAADPLETAAAAGPGWLGRVRARRGWGHMAGQILPRLSPPRGGGPSLPGPARSPWRARALSLLRRAARTARDVSGRQAASPSAPLGGRF